MKNDKRKEKKSLPKCTCPMSKCPVHGELDKAELRKGRRVRR